MRTTCQKYLLLRTKDVNVVVPGPPGAEFLMVVAFGMCRNASDVSGVGLLDFSVQYS